ncbi:hypothetical protein ACV1EC_04065 [Aeromonas hydrophila]
MMKAVFAVTDESDEGACPLIDMTKVTRSTPADKTLPHQIDRHADEVSMESI